MIVNLIALSGKNYSGKTTAAEYLVSRVELNFVRLSFAEKLKEIAVRDFAYCGVTPELIKNGKTQLITVGSRQITVRQLLIDIGTKYRELDSEFWIRSLWHKAEEQIRLGKNVIIDDLRFLNECGFLKRHGAFLVRINRNGVPLLNDSSETQLDDFAYWDEVIDNNGTIPDLYKVVDGVYTLLERRLRS